MVFTRRLLARSAGRYANAGWPVIPGAWWDGTRYRCAAPGCHISGLHPAGDRDTPHPLDPTGSTQPDVQGWWSTHRHTVLLATGGPVAAVQAPAVTGRRVVAALRRAGVVVPAAVLPTGRWLLLTTPPPDSPTPDLPGGVAGVVWHGPGSYIPLPPSTLARGPVRWVHAPWVTDWALPDTQAVLDALIPRQRRVPRQAPASIHWT